MAHSHGLVRICPDGWSGRYPGTALPIAAGILSFCSVAKSTVTRETQPGDIRISYKVPHHFKTCKKLPALLLIQILTVGWLPGFFDISIVPIPPLQDIQRQFYLS